MRRGLVVLAATLSACQRLDPEASGSESTTTTTDSASASPSGSPPPPDLPPSDDGVGFIGGTEMGGKNIECSIWDQDCPEREKCMPWANDGGNSWNATKCTPLDPNPAGVGEPCTVEGSGVSGIDNCDIKGMCWNVDPETLEGYCVAFCVGSENNPFCEDPSSRCNITSDGVLLICIPTCNPLGNDCRPGLGCVASDDRFVCVHLAMQGQYGDPCEFVNVCADGLLCASADSVPECTGSQGCCTQFCDVTLARQQCAGFPEQQCIPWYQDGQAPPGLENVGACTVPR